MFSCVVKLLYALLSLIVYLCKISNHIHFFVPEIFISDAYGMKKPALENGADFMVQLQEHFTKLVLVVWYLLMRCAEYVL